MEKSKLIPTIYGYAICLVAVITFLIATTSLVNSIIDNSDPMHSGYRCSNMPSLASFENYKMDVLNSSDKEQAFVPDEQTLIAMYEAAKTDKIQSAQHQTLRTIVVSSFIIVLCFVFFIFHWRWMRKLA